MPYHSDQYLSDLPKLTNLLPAILCKSNKVFSKEQALPKERYWVENIQLAMDNMKVFNQLTAWHHNDIVHPGYLHTLGFPLQLKLMLHKGFPFSMMGVVHIANKIVQYQKVHPESRVDVSCQLGEIKQLKMGCLFAIETEFFVEQQRVMYAKHQYLRRADSLIKPKTRIPQQSNWMCSDKYGIWPLSATLGWQYAKCSQDFNPIHLHPLSAKLLGFKQHIIHGMWMKSRAFSALCGTNKTNLSPALNCEVEFKKPLFLPNTVLFQQRTLSSNENTEFRISSNVNHQTIEHMTGRLAILDS